MKFVLLLIGFALTTTAHAKPINQLECPTPLSIEQINDRTKVLHDITLNQNITYQRNQNTFIKDVRYDNLQHFYNQCVQPQISNFTLASLNAEELDTLFEALKRINFYIPKSELTQYLLNIVAQQEPNNKTLNSNIADIYRAMVNLRQFDKAKRLAKQYPNIELPKLPEQINLQVQGSGKTLLRLDETGKQLERVDFKPNGNSYVVIISSPNCFASNRFVEWLHQAQNIQFKNLFAKHAFFITPPSDILFVERLTQINQKYAQLDMQTSFAKTDWPEIDYWGTPTMNFYQNGKLVNQLVGWPKKGQKQALIDALTEVQLLD